MPDNKYFDEDFLPEVKALYNSENIEHVPLDIIFSHAVSVCTRIGDIF